MNLQALTVEAVPVGVPLPWPIFDRQGYTVFAPGDVIADRKMLTHLVADGLLRDVDVLPEDADAPSWLETGSRVPSEIFPPLGIKPQIWERVQLRLLGKEAQAYYVAHLIGYIKNRSILLTAPESAGQRIGMSAGERLEVRMFTGGNIYVFQSVIQRICTSPSHYMHIDYPSRLRMQKLRRSPWAAVGLTATASNPHGAETLARIVNLSPDGAQLQIAAAMGSKRQPLRLSFNAAIDGLHGTLVLESLIQHVHPARVRGDEPPGLLEYGVEFRNVAERDALWLRALVYRRIAEGHPG